MGKSKSVAAVAAGNNAKIRHKKNGKGDNSEDWHAPLPAGLNPRREKPVPKDKHRSFFDVFENKDKKKKPLDTRVACPGTSVFA
jgi:hypothetical protein